jgi:hypothetical protein
MNSHSEHTSLPVETQYLPPISEFVRMRSFSHITIYGEENFRKSTWRNRCRIIGANRIILLSIPITGGRGVRVKTKDVRIANDQPWQRSHWRSIVAAYGKSSFFIFYEEKFRKIYEKQFEFLIDVNSELLQVCFEILRWEKDIVLHPSNKYPLPEAVKSKIPDKKIVASNDPTSKIFKYHQVFQSKHGFITDLSIIDLIFNLGNEASNYLEIINGASLF